ncbi:MULTISPECIES: DUF3540 domain-containing protein [Oleiagrimonas]|jgi:hypothetical protein|uniref:DUF3540 domain-containing protein n=1 Tax=Oleiagrimonas citrea TaxID=1665687 RepID=A0A846ZQ95_9GAMM|nr:MULTISPECIES: DUF3540 domain-containing protein [Oleiagrimonas]NKZ40186.1 DUF3540 domain-containing protein [Oleiagrimonas citrea]RAP57888.1 hypothetical protein BTJ49_08465 [Oleiagrimonas sp. MCCC 1A03011]
MFATQRRRFTRAQQAPEWSEAVVREALDGGIWLMQDGRSARQAVSCLITPQPGDVVLLVRTAEGRYHVLHVLDREEREEVVMAVPGAQRLSIRQPDVDVTAEKTISMRAADTVDITAARGPLSLNARNVFTSAAESLVQTASHYVGQVEHFLVTARQLLRIDSEQALITARQDAKIDAERVSLG